MNKRQRDRVRGKEKEGVTEGGEKKREERNTHSKKERERE